jgi:hypothetical protein
LHRIQERHREAERRRGLIGRLYQLVILAVAPAMAVLIYDKVQLRQTREAAVHGEDFALRSFDLIRDRPDDRRDPNSPGRGGVPP